MKVDKLELIYDATISLVKKVGIAEVSVSKIAKEAGIGKGSVYYYVETKNDILEGIANKTVRRIVEEYHTVVSDSDLDVFGRMELQFRVLSTRTFSDGTENYMHTLFVQPDMYLHERLKSAIMKYSVPTLAQNIVEGTQQGLFKSDDPQKSAELIVMAMLMVFDGQLLPTQEMLDTMERMQYLLGVVEKSLSAPKGSLGFVTSIMNDRIDGGANGGT